MIKWKHGDYVKLGKAVANFNKKIGEIANTDNYDILPQPIDYKDLKSRIYNRKELNRKIKSLKNFLLDRSGKNNCFIVTEKK